MDARRRGLVTGSLTSAAGSCALVGTQSSAAASTDAGLIALCAEFSASEAAFCAIYDSAEHVADDAICDTLAAPIRNSWPGMLSRMATFRASTPEVLAAQVMALAQQSGINPGTDNCSFAFDPENGTVTGKLLHYLLRDALVLAGRT